MNILAKSYNWYYKHKIASVLIAFGLLLVLIYFFSWANTSNSNNNVAQIKEKKENTTSNELNTALMYCAKIEDVNQKEVCYDNYYSEEAIKRLDENLCNNINSTSDKNHCYCRIAKNKLDPKICLNILPEYSYVGGGYYPESKNECVEDIALCTLNESICDFIGDDPSPYITKWNKQDCKDMINMALAKGDKSYNILCSSFSDC